MLRGSLKSEFKTPAVVPVAKGSNNIVMDCTKQGLEDGEAVVTSRVGAATFGNVLAGGLIGAVVDQATGKAYNYPDWIQILMGKILGFDRSNQQDGKPTKGLPMDGVVDPSPNPARPAMQPAAEPAKAEESKK
jgi:hypothetical protein